MKNTPGSLEAIVLGCICPILENKIGEGADTGKGSKRLFCINIKCPIHKNIAESELQKRQKKK